MYIYGERYSVVEFLQVFHFYKYFFDNQEKEIKEKSLMISNEYAYYVTSLTLSHLILLRTYEEDLISLSY